MELSLNERYRVIPFGELPSTNGYARDHIGLLRDGDVIIARNQTAGYGRHGRTWLTDDSENALLSIVLKPTNRVDHTLPISTLPHYTAVILTRVLASYAPEPKIKWPNDIFIGNLKVGGILSESLIMGNQLDGIIIGIGVNLNASAEVLASVGQPATSLAALIGSAVSREEFIESLLATFFAGYDAFLKEGFASIRDEYAAKSLLTGTWVTVTEREKIVTGIVRGVDAGGALTLETDGGETLIFSGDIASVRRGTLTPPASSDSTTQ